MTRISAVNAALGEVVEVLVSAVGAKPEKRLWTSHRGAAMSTTVFRAGEGGFPCVRVPSLLAIPGTSTLLAFAECRLFTGDGCYLDPQHNHSGDERLRLPCMKRSADGGKSWGSLRSLSATHGSYPTVVYLPLSKAVLLQYSTWPHNESYGKPLVQQMVSTDFGVTWSAPARVRGVPNAYLGGCRGAVTARGRVLFAAYNHTGHPRTFETRVWHSDDGGVTFVTSPDAIHGAAEPGIAAINETHVEIVARSNGALGCACQNRILSDDSGASWRGRVRNVSDLVSPGCQGSFVADAYSKPVARMLYSGPGSPTSRKAMSLWESTDSGARWSRLSRLSSVDASYSCLETTPEAVHVLWETGPDSDETRCYGPTCRIVLSTLSRNNEVVQ